MTSLRMLGSRGLLLGLALVSIATNQGLGQPSKPRRVELLVLDSKANAFGKVVSDGDRFVALDCRKGDKIGDLSNFRFATEDKLQVDGKYLGYDVRGENKNVLVRGGTARTSNGSSSAAGRVASRHAFG